MAHPLSARLVLLAAAAALAACLVLAIVMAEHRDVDGPVAKRAGAVSAQRADGPAVAALRQERARAVFVRFAK